MLNVYQVSKTAWIVANSYREAKAFAINEVESGFFFPRRVPDNRLHHVVVTHYDGREMSFRKSLDLILDEGIEARAYVVPDDMPFGECPWPSLKIIVDVASSGIWHGRRKHCVDYDELDFLSEYAEMHSTGALYSDFLWFYQWTYSIFFRFGGILPANVQRKEKKLNETGSSCGKKT